MRADLSCKMAPFQVRTVIKNTGSESCRSGRTVWAPEPTPWRICATAWSRSTTGKSRVRSGSIRPITRITWRSRVYFQIWWGSTQKRKTRRIARNGSAAPYSETNEQLWTLESCLRSYHRHILLGRRHITFNYSLKETLRLGNHLRSCKA